MMKIPPLWKEVMLPKALEKSTVHDVTHTLNMDGNNPSSFHHSLPILPIQLPTALNHYPPSGFAMLLLTQISLEISTTYIRVVQS